MISFANIDKPFLDTPPLFLLLCRPRFLLFLKPIKKYLISNPLKQNLQLFCYKLEILVLGTIILS